jgi:hypothetical protein
VKQCRNREPKRTSRVDAHIVNATKEFFVSQTTMSDGALSILVFAAYHSLVSGEAVTRVVLDDGKGHKADAEGVREMEEAGLLEPAGERGVLTEAGRDRLAKLIETLRRSA